MAAHYHPSPIPSSSASSSSSFATIKIHSSIEPRFVTRTPSPTPEEAELLKQSGLNGRLQIRKYLHRKYIPQLTLAFITFLILFLSVAFQDQIITKLVPFGKQIKAIPAGWLIPVAALVVLSFPPLFGHDIIAVVVGVIWGIGIGFGIVAFGTLLGEIANYFVFKYLFRSRAQKYERKGLKYGLLSQVVREGGFKIVLMLRLSAIPPHFSTLVFTLSGVNFLVFFIAAVLSLPRQLATVVVGNLAAQSSLPNAHKPKYSTVISTIIITISVIVTVLSMHYVNRKVDDAKPSFVRSRQKARQAEMEKRAQAEYAKQETSNPDFERGLHRSSNVCDLVIAAPQPRLPSMLTFSPLHMTMPMPPEPCYPQRQRVLSDIPSLSESDKSLPTSYKDTRF